MTADTAGRSSGATMPWSAPAGAFVVAAAAAGYLAWNNGPRPDELHTLAHVREPSLTVLWTSYRGAVDATPPFAYVWSWCAARVLGTGLVATRLPFVGCWGLAAASLAVATRRAGPWAAFGAGILPTATSLVYLGAYARPYAPVLAALGVALVCWQRIGDDPGSRGWPLALAASCFLAVALHYAAAVVVAAMVGVGWASCRRGRGPGARWVAPLAGGGSSLLASSLLLVTAVDAQRTMARSARLLDAATFWPSAARPAWPVLVPVALTAGVSAWRRHGRCSGVGSGLAPELVRLGWAVAVGVPVVALGVMAASSGVYFHRYAATATLGAGIVLAAAVGRSDQRRSGASVLVAALLLVGCVVATADSAGSTPSRWRVGRLASDLGIQDRGRNPVLVVNEYDYLLLRHDAGPALRGRLRLGAELGAADVPPGVVGTPDRVDPVALAREVGEPVELIGSPGEVAAYRARPDLRVTCRGSASYVRPGSDRELVRCTLERR